MKVWLDDTVPAPRGWRRTYTAQQTIELLQTGKVTEISLDHDLGDEKVVGTGNTVLIWIEEQVVMNNFHPPLIDIHTKNAGARPKMELARRNIERLAARRKKEE